MPRRRAVRVVGASLAAFAVPGVSPRMALGASASNHGCGADVRACPRIVNLGTAPPLCCGAPARRYICEGTPANPTCKDSCTTGEPCKSTRKDQDGFSYFQCCKRPTEKCLNDACVPNCALQGKRQCGKSCCEVGEKCVNDRCVVCGPGESSCETRGGGAHKCCQNQSERCCFNKTTTACCGNDQICKAAGVKTATCVCKPGTGTKCGSNCCGNDERCCGGNECCAKSETCCGGRTCCTTGQTCCGGTTCCAQNEWCLHKDTGTIFNLPSCKSSCAPGNRCGRQCCGTGYRCVSGKCVR